MRIIETLRASDENVFVWHFDEEFYDSESRSIVRPVLAHDEYHNLVVNAGLIGLSNRLLGLASQGAFTDLAIGTGVTSPAAAQTALVTELTSSGLTQGAATLSLTDNGSGVSCKMNWDKTWTKGDAGSVAIAEAGIFNAQDTMLSRVLIGPYTTAQSQQLRILWTMTPA